MRYGNLALFLASVLSFQARASSEAKISGPYTYDNLSIFLIHQSGDAKASTVRYLALQPAMEQKKVVVYETNQVNALAIENLSSDPVFVQQGDIVKGGNQDRMISNDFIVPPKSGRLPLAAFCVEQGRWHPRGKEPVKTFSPPSDIAVVRFNPKAAWNQMSVWGTVSAIQEALASHLQKQKGAGVASVRVANSPTSLALTQNSLPVEEAVGAYTRVLAGAVEGKTGVIGYAFAVNGDVKSADVYASAALFSLMWPKLLKSSAVEALRMREQGKTAPVKASQVEAFLREANSGKETSIDVDRRLKLVKRESERHLLVESREGTYWVHRSVVKK